MRHRLPFLLGFAVLFLIPVLYFGSINEAVSDWVASYYYVNYGYGFIRRGLVGSIALLFPDVKTFAFWSTFVASLLTAYVFTLLTEDRRLWLLFLLSPATALHLGFDVGRYDHFNLLLLTTSLLILKRRRDPLPVLPLTLLAVLIHEAYLLYAVPVVVSHLWDRERGLAVATALLSILLGLYLSLWGGLDRAVVEELAVKTGAMRGALEALSVGVRGTVMGNLSYVLPEVVRRPWDFVLPLTILTGYSVLYLSSLQGYPLRKVLAPFSGLLLFAFGYDYPRWVSIIVIILLLQLATLLPSLRLTRPLKVLYALLLSTTLLGPLGAGHYAFPLLEALIFRTPPY